MLAIYRQKLEEYAIDSNDQIRVVATSAVREASNQLAFQDRVFIATGFEIESFDVAELHRVTYLGILPFLDQMDKEAESGELSGHNVVCEVGGGSTEILVLKGSDVHYSHTFRFGALRIRRTLEALHVPLDKMRGLMETQIQHVVADIHESLEKQRPTNLIAMGSEMRWIANEILNKNPAREIVTLPLKKLREFNESIELLTPEKLAHRYPIGLPAAQTLGPTLLAFELLAEALNIDEIAIANVNLRDGLITEMGMNRRYNESIEKQIIRSAITVGRKYHFDESHAVHVAKISRQLFDQLKELHQLEDRMGSLLHIGALLHEIGYYVGARGYHKHSMYLIRNSEFFGIGASDLLIISLIARYHRRAMPQARHDGYSSLNRARRVIVSKLSAILRIALALDAGRSQRIQTIDCQRIGNRVLVRVKNVTDTSMEQLELNQSNDFFEAIFGCRVVLEAVKAN